MPECDLVNDTNLHSITPFARYIDTVLIKLLILSGLPVCNKFVLCEYCQSHILLKTRFFGRHSVSQLYEYIFNYFDVVGLQSCQIW